MLASIKKMLAARRVRRFEQMLRGRGVALGENIRWGNLKTISIDVTRPTLLEIGAGTTINSGTEILTHDFVTNLFLDLHGDFVNSSGKVVIGRNVYFARNCTVLKGVTIGDNCVIGYGAVVTKDGTMAQSHRRWPKHVQFQQLHIRPITTLPRRPRIAAESCVRYKMIVVPAPIS